MEIKQKDMQKITPNNGLSPAPSIRLSDQVYENVLEKIVTGEFPVNSKLPTENVLSKTLNVSRPVLRQALARLRQDELISSRQGSGSYVTRQPAPDILNFAPTGTFADIQRCYEFRSAVEGAAAGLAAEHRTAEQLSIIEQAVRNFEDCVNSGKNAPITDTDFHTRLGQADEVLHSAVCEATANPFFVSTRQSIATHMEHGRKLSLQLVQSRNNGEMFLHSIAEHRAVFEAIRDQNAQAASEQMQTHINNSRRRIFEN